MISALYIQEINRVRQMKADPMSLADLEKRLWLAWEDLRLALEKLMRTRPWESGK